MIQKINLSIGVKVIGNIFLNIVQEHFILGQYPGCGSRGLSTLGVVNSCDLSTLGVCQPLGCQTLGACQLNSWGLSTLGICQLMVSSRLRF